MVPDYHSFFAQTPKLVRVGLICFNLIGKQMGPISRASVTFPQPCIRLSGKVFGKLLYLMIA